ncbi:MAG: hypothetical protein CSYNP_01554 [Syntrophus sp. SKADARSKE-3]|nr:hypothetical protein [Syntrophus sp. SKADARSKE-3]
MKKAKIDVLDLPDLEATPADASEAFKLDISEPQIDLQRESFLTPPEEEAKPLWRRLVTTKRVIIFGSIVLLLAVTFVVYFVFIDKKPSQMAAKGSKESRATATGQVTEPVYIDNLTAVITDLSGKQRVVLFGIAAMPGKGVAPNYDGKDPDIRVAASKAVCSASFPELMNDKGRDQIKRKIKDAIEIVKGPGTVEHVYITSWTIL